MNTSPLHISFPSQPLPHVYAQVVHWWFGSGMLLVALYLLALILVPLAIVLHAKSQGTEDEIEMKMVVYFFSLVIIPMFLAISLNIPIGSSNGSVVSHYYTNANLAGAESPKAMTNVEELSFPEGEQVLDENSKPVYAAPSLSSAQSEIVNTQLEQHYRLQALNTKAVTLLKDTSHVPAQVNNAQTYTDKNGAVLSCALRIDNVKTDAAQRYQSFDIQNVFCSKQGLTNAQLMQQVK